MIESIPQGWIKGDPVRLRQSRGEFLVELHITAEEGFRRLVIERGWRDAVAYLRFPTKIEAERFIGWWNQQATSSASEQT